MADEYSDKNDIRLAINYGAYEIAGDVWQHQQQRIDIHISINKSLLMKQDELQAKLKIAVDALKEVESNSYQQDIGGGDVGIVTCEALEKVTVALKQIEVK